MRHYTKAILVSIGSLVGGALVALPGSASAAVANYSANNELNRAASAAASAVASAVSAEPNFAGERIISSGLEVDVTDGPTAHQRSLINSAAEAGIRHHEQLNGVSDLQSVPIHYRTVRWSLAQLNAVTNQIDRDFSMWAQHGINLTTWGPDIQSNTVTVSIDPYRSEYAAQLVDTYGAEVTVLQTPISAVASDSRTDDHPPYWFGADSLSKSENGNRLCTSWFAASGPQLGNVVMTAGHCGSHHWWVADESVGTTSHLVFSGNIDAQVAGHGDPLDNVWADPHKSHRVVEGVIDNNQTGLYFCTDGATDREVCDVKIVNTGRHVYYDGKTITGLVYAVQQDGRAAFTGGDSGGPVYTVEPNGTVMARGMLVAHVSGDATRGWFVPAKTLENFYNISIKTSQ